MMKYDTKSSNLLEYSMGIKRIENISYRSTVQVVIIPFTLRSEYPHQILSIESLP